MRALRVVYCHAHEDKRRLEPLKSHLVVLKRLGLIVPWHDGNISSETDWEQEVLFHVNRPCVKEEASQPQSR